VNDNRRMLSRTLTFVVWALVAASAVFWGMKLLARPLAVPANATVAARAPAVAGDLSGLFGVKPAPAAPVVEDAAPPPPESSRFQLLGVVAARHAARAQGVALIAVDGKLPRAYRVGAVVDGDLVLQSVQSRAVSIGRRGGVAEVSLELPSLPPPATGVPGAAAVAPMAQPGLPPPGMPGMPPGMPSPPQLAVQPQVMPQLQPQARFRSARNFGGQPGGMPLPGAAPAAQEEALPNDGAQPPDGRNLR
jgi:general secretion pathway protein C